MRYLFALRCLDCAAQLTHQADGTVTPTATAAIATCTVCGLQHRIDLRLTPLRTDRPQSVKVPTVTHAQTDYGADLIKLLQETP